MQNKYEGSNRSPGTEDRGASDAQTNSGISGTTRAFARQLDEIERLLDQHHAASNTGGLNGQSPALNEEQEENAVEDEERSDDADTDPEKDSEQQCNEIDSIDRGSLFDSPNMRRKTEQLVTAPVRSRQKPFPLIERDCGTEDSPPCDDDPGKDLNAKVEAFVKEVEELRHEVAVFKARLEEANEIVRRISKAPRTNKVETLAQLKEAIEKVRRMGREIEKAAAIVGNN